MPISKRNRTGVSILILFCLAIIFAPRIICLFDRQDKPTLSFLEAKGIEVELKEERIKSEKGKSTLKKRDKYVKPSCKMNPNQMSIKDWRSLGVSERQAEVIVSFSKRGLKSNEDLKKIYVLPDRLFDLIKDSMDYSPEKNTSIVTDQVKVVQDIVVNINKASQEDLLQLKGIGPYFSEKIIRYRNVLGGFVSKEQLLEVWRMDAERYQKIEKYIQIDSSEIVRISLNNASIDQLKKHPYINYNVANSIVKMRDQNGGYTKKEELLKSKLVDQLLLDRIKPYLTIE